MKSKLLQIFGIGSILLMVGLLIALPFFIDGGVLLAGNTAIDVILFTAFFLTVSGSTAYCVITARTDE